MSKVEDLKRFRCCVVGPSGDQVTGSEAVPEEVSVFMTVTS